MGRVTQVMRTNWKPILMVVLSSLLATISNAGFGFWLFAWVAWVPLFLVLKTVSNWKRSFWYGYMFGFIQYAATFFWVALLAPFAETGNMLTNWLITCSGFVAMCLYLALYPAILCTLIFPIWHKQTVQESNFLFVTSLIFKPAIIWTGLEWMSEWMLSGFPWTSIGYTQWPNLPVIQIASIFGVHGVSFILLLFNSLMAVLIISKWKQHIAAVVLPSTIIVSSFVFGLVELKRSIEATDQVRVAIVPGNIRQNEKWKPKNFSSIFDHYLDLIEKASTKNDIKDLDLDFVALPETAFPRPIFTRLPNTYSHQLQKFQRKREVNLLAGAPHYTYEKKTKDGKIIRKAYNNVFFLSWDGRQLGSYAKTHLVPFGEYVPLMGLLPDLIQLPTGFTPGSEYSTFPVPNHSDLRMGVAICFESSFPNLVRQFTLKGANLIGILTNDAWFENTPAPKQHFSMAPFRAIENRVPVFRCANGGYSCIIDGFGRLITSTIQPENTEGLLVYEIPVAADVELTLSTRWGNWFPIFCFLSGLFQLALQSRFWVKRVGKV